MMQSPDAVKQKITVAPNARRWLVTGAAGFIGSNLVEALLRLDQSVVGIDNFATGSKANLSEIQAAVAPAQWAKFSFIEGDITDLATCRAACEGVSIVLHEAAIGSVPRSIDEPLATHAANVTGHLNMLIAAKDAAVDRFIYASSSSVYGDAPGLPQRENQLGRPLSPYAASKRAAELYADAFARCYGLRVIGLRYFNVFGPRQNADGPYAGVIPRWTRAMLRDEPVVIFGDGTSSRDFCYVANVVHANLCAAVAADPAAFGGVFNIATSAQATLNELYDLIAARIKAQRGRTVEDRRDFRPSRAGDLQHSRADVSLAKQRLGYVPVADLAAGLDETVRWHCSRT